MKRFLLNSHKDLPAQLSESLAVFRFPLWPSCSIESIVVKVWFCDCFALWGPSTLCTLGP
jgi:hypothetical protein